jgi:hypothetical protein
VKESGEKKAFLLPFDDFSVWQCATKGEEKKRGEKLLLSSLSFHLLSFSFPRPPRAFSNRPRSRPRGDLNRIAQALYQPSQAT